MPSDNSCNMWVFRDGRSRVAGRSVLQGLASALRGLGISPGRDALTNALLRAGELECALADAASPQAARLAGLTDQVAAALLDGELSHPVSPAGETRVGHPSGAAQEWARALEEIEVPDWLDLPTSEGFAYYALHPLDFAELSQQAPLAGAQAAVVGIRSIGATLSAVVTAALARRGLRARRITARPTGHPFDRRCEFNSEQLSWIDRQRAHNADFLVVDEGPGISGSSFLSVGDALLRAGVERRRITFLCSRHADPDLLVAREAGVRWRAFRCLYSGPTAYVPPEAKIYVGGGAWRRYFYGAEAQWPASWVQMERLKFLSADGARLYKFEGLGRFGVETAERARRLAGGGFGPRLEQLACGFAEYPVLRGRPMSEADVSPAVLERLADYCVFRAAEFAAPAAPGPELEQMLRFNVGEEFGVQPDAGTSALAVARPIVADGRMLPQEWLATAEGVLKSDGVSHGDDHFFPGVTDIAWDLAGAMVEWEMTRDAGQYFLERYGRRSGDDPRPRLPAYLLAYSTFRMAYCAMAAFAVRGSEEEPRLRRAWRRYRAHVEAMIGPAKLAGGQRPVASGREELAAD